jgi:hypothetical protein
MCKTCGRIRTWISIVLMLIRIPIRVWIRIKMEIPIQNSKREDKEE